MESAAKSVSTTLELQPWDVWIGNTRRDVAPTELVTLNGYDRFKEKPLVADAFIIIPSGEHTQ